MRVKQDTQAVLDFHRPTLALTAEYYARYEGIDQILRENRRILDLVHRDLEKALENENRERERGCRITSDQVLRVLICKTIEAETYRGITVRIDDSDFLRKFVGIHYGPMMEFTTLNKLANCIQPETCEAINLSLAKYAVEHALVDGGRARLDTTAIETNIRYPTDSGLMWDTYRVLARLISRARELAPEVVGNRRLHVNRVKKLHALIGRQSSRRNTSARKLRKPYKAMIRLVEAILAWATDVADRLERLGKRRGRGSRRAVGDLLISNLRHFCDLGTRAVDQARRRVLNGEKVPNEEKIFSIFEPHTELLKRGKAGKDIEFGHMVLIQQAEGTFITHYRVFEKKPVEYELVEEAVKTHEKLFGEKPDVLAADKGFYESMDRIEELERDIELVAIGKKGRLSEEEAQREGDILFKMAQMFRAGIEGTISFFKRCLRLIRCLNKGVVHYAATVGLTVLAHNLLVLVRDT